MADTRETEIFPVIEEEARIDKREVSTGKVRIRTPIDVKTEIASAKLEEDQVEIVRVPVNRAVHETPPVRRDKDTLIIPIMEEVLVVEKQLVLKEELHVRRRVVEDQIEVPVSVRKQRVVVERLSAGGGSDKPEENEG